MKVNKISRQQQEIAKLMTNTDRTHLFDGIEEERKVFMMKERLDNVIEHLYAEAVKVLVLNAFNNWRKLDPEFIAKTVGTISAERSKTGAGDVFSGLAGSLNELEELKREHIVGLIYATNVGLVVWSATNYIKSHSVSNRELNDLLMMGITGLHIAIEAFDYKKGNKFSTFATWWIKQPIGLYREQTNLIRVPTKVNSIGDDDKRITVLATDSEKQKDEKRKLKKLVDLNRKLLSTDKQQDDELAAKRSEPRVEASQGEDLHLSDITRVLDDLFEKYLTDEEIVVACYNMGFHSVKYNINPHEEKLSAMQIARIVHKDSHKISGLWSTVQKKLKNNKRAVIELSQVFDLQEWSWNDDLAIYLPLNGKFPELRATYNEYGEMTELHCLYNVWDPYKIAPYIKRFKSFKAYSKTRSQLLYVEIVKNQLKVKELNEAATKMWEKRYWQEKMPANAQRNEIITVKDDDPEIIGSEDDAVQQTAEKVI